MRHSACFQTVWRQNVLAAPVLLLAEYRFFNPLEELFYLQVPFRFLDLGWFFIGRSWTKAAGIVVALLGGLFLLAEYFQPRELDEDESDDDEDEAD